jgi:hypothetical protein
MGSEQKVLFSWDVGLNSADDLSTALPAANGQLSLRFPHALRDPSSLSMRLIDFFKNLFPNLMYCDLILLNQGHGGHGSSLPWFCSIQDFPAYIYCPLFCPSLRLHFFLG